jgi:3-deoxy-D-manno-octulosonate 8-phosphate phosphatase (KDO 8-P phosphatase)
VKKIADYISPKSGGEGIVREMIEKVMKIQGTWD